MPKVTIPNNYFLGANIINPRVYFTTIKAIIANLNSITTGNGVLTSTVAKRVASPINITATATAAQVAAGYLTSTSAAAVTITLPTAASLAALLGATAGSTFTFLVDNSAGANTVTVAVNTGITTTTPVITGENVLTVSTANSVGEFRLIFTSTTAAILFREY